MSNKQIDNDLQDRHPGVFGSGPPYRKAPLTNPKLKLDPVGFPIPKPPSN